MKLLIQYIFFGITLAISIGPVNLELIKQGVSRGFIPSWLVGIGAMTADLAIINIIYLGLGPLFTSHIIQIILGFIGSFMLIYIGIQNTRNKNKNSDFHKHDIVIEKKAFTTGFILAIANPLNIVFWTGIFGSLLTVKTSNQITPLWLLVSIFLGITLSNIFLALMSAMGKSYVKPSILSLITFTSGVVLIGYGLWNGYITIFTKLLN